MTDANNHVLTNHDFLQRLGISLEEQREGAVRLSLPYDDSLVNRDGNTLHGGVVATFVDHAGGAAIRTTLEEPLQTEMATTDLNVSYVRPATGDLTATGTVVRSGRTMGVVEVEVTAATEDGEQTVAVGRVSLHLDRD